MYACVYVTECACASVLCIICNAYFASRVSSLVTRSRNSLSCLALVTRTVSTIACCDIIASKQRCELISLPTREMHRARSLLFLSHSHPLYLSVSLPSSPQSSSSEAPLAPHVSNLQGLASSIIESGDRTHHRACDRLRHATSSIMHPSLRSPCQPVLLV